MKALYLELLQFATVTNRLKHFVQYFHAKKEIRALSQELIDVIEEPLDFQRQSNIFDESLDTSQIEEKKTKEQVAIDNLKLDDEINIMEGAVRQMY